MNREGAYKLILAIMQKMDFDDCVQELGKNQIFVTKLSSSGGFLKKENVTAMIGVEAGREEQVLDILRKLGGKRRQTVYTVPTMQEGCCPPAGASVPVSMETGGVTVFVMELDSFMKF